MKKIIYLISILMIVVFSICACDKNEEYTNNNFNNIEINNSDITKQNENIINEVVSETNTNTESQETGLVEENKLNQEDKESVEKEETQELQEIQQSQETQQAESISVSASTLSNKKCAWGFVRQKNEVRPQFSAGYTKVLDDYEGIYAGDPEQKVIYLTFDEGYENGYTASILDTLKEKDCPATFFVTKPYVKQNQELVKRMIDEGHIVGNHTVNHPSMPEVADDEKLKSEITGLHDYVKDLFDYDMEFLRPPKGEYSERTVAISRELGYRTVLWSSAYDDWDVNKQGRLEYARGMILNYLHNGCVMLLHAVSKDNTELLGEVIDEIRNRGYEIRALTEFEA